MFYHTISDPFQKRKYLLSAIIDAHHSNELLLKLKEWDDRYLTAAESVIEETISKLSAPDFNTEKRGKRKASKSNFASKKLKTEDNLGSFVTFTAIENGQEISVTPIRYSKRLENKSEIQSHTICMQNLGDHVITENKLEQLPTSIQNQEMLNQFNMSKEDKQILDKIKAKSTTKENKAAIPIKNFSMPSDLKEWKDMINKIAEQPGDLNIEKIIDKNYKSHNNFIIFKVDEESAIKLRTHVFATPRCNPLSLKGTDELLVRQDLSELYDKNYGMLLLSDDLKMKLRKFPDLANELN